MWFSQDGIDFVASLGATGINFVEKASFGQGPIFKDPNGPSANPGFKYQPALPSEDEEENNANL